MRDGTGYAFDISGVEITTGKCDVCKMRFQKERFNSGVLYSLHPEAGLHELPRSYSVIFCSKPCFEKWMKDKYKYKTVWSQG